MNKSFSHIDRYTNLNKLETETFDLAIIGGGINGAGIARDAASRGMKVALVEVNDFASGTSSRSSKLVHGGIRYLENFEFGLVFEALSERARLFDMAPHLVHPLRFVLPVYKGDRVGMTKLGAGMAVYDLLSTYEAPELHERLNAEESLERLPLLNKNSLRGSYVYSDAYMDDDRLVIESLRSANDHGAVIANYIGVDSFVEEEGKIKALQCTDVLNNKKITVKAKHFVGSVGPWTDQFLGDKLKDWKKKLRPTKGVHITVARDRVALKEAVVMVSNDQKRIVFGIPRHEMTIFGTTDTDFKEDPREVTTKKEDIDYLLNLVNEYFPGAQLSEEDIIASYAGVRPLVYDGAESEGKTSREHEVWDLENSLTVVAGGKYTTYRLIAEQVMDKVLDNFSIEDQVAFDKSASKELLNPLVSFDSMQIARASVNRWKRNTGFSEELLHKMIDRHGMEALRLLRMMQAGETANEELMWVLEARHAVKNTMCINLRDFYFRRTPLFLAYKDHGMSFLESIKQEFKDEFGWTQEEEEKQVAQLKEQMDFDLAWRN
jgi:glycerol-3-phosphate dehydrogenase